MIVLNIQRNIFSTPTSESFSKGFRQEGIEKIFKTPALPRVKRRKLAEKIIFEDFKG